MKQLECRNPLHSSCSPFAALSASMSLLESNLLTTYDGAAELYGSQVACIENGGNGCLMSSYQSRNVGFSNTGN